MKTLTPIVIYVFVMVLSSELFAQGIDTSITERRILVSDYRNKMMAGWIGQMVGVGWGEPTEFRYMAKTIPADKVPEWQAEMVDVFNQDDLYVEMTFLRSLEVYGIDVSINQAGLDFANSKYNIAVANKSGRDNLRKGIAPPNSGHPDYNENADAIDYQIESDFSGLISPGLPNMVIKLGEKFGHLMNYGDGVYGGQFVGAMYAEAFFENDPLKIVETGLKAIPEGSQYAEAIRDVIKWYRENPDDWEATWKKVNKKYHENPDYRRFTTPAGPEELNIDAKLNGAYIVIGLLYGQGDIDQTIITSMRCGQDSDCNPSNAAGILFTSIGYDKIPEKYLSHLDRNTKFNYSEYTFSELIDVCEKLSRQIIKKAGGRIETNTDGQELFVIPVANPVPTALEQSWNPGPLSTNAFSEEELSQITGHWIYNFSLLILFMIAIVLFKENRNLKALSILLPLAASMLIIELSKLFIDPTYIDILNITVVLESLSAGIAIILLLGQRVSSANAYISILIALVILALAGVAGVIGFYDGRYVAGTVTTLNFYAIEAVVWLLAIILTVLFTRKKFSLLRFNLFAPFSFFILHLVGIFLILFQKLAAYMATSEIIEFIDWILMGAVVLTIVYEIITVPYLLLTYWSTEYNQRLRNWIGQNSSG